VDKRREVCELEGYVWESETTGVSSMLRLMCDLDEDFTNLRFELGVENSSAETEQVLVLLRLLYS